MIYIYFCYLSEKAHGALLSKYAAKFTSEDQERIKRYRRWQDAQAFIMGRILLFEGMKQMKISNYNLKILRYSEYNKPYFEDNIVKFNISHSGDIVVCALSSEFEIGIDIEEIKNIEIADFKSQMTENEWLKIQSSENALDSFFEYWTQKEAVIKAHGHGLSIPLRSFEIIANQTNINDEFFYLTEIEIDPYYRCFVSLKSKEAEVLITQYRINSLIAEMSYL